MLILRNECFTIFTFVPLNITTVDDFNEYIYTRWYINTYRPLGIILPPNYNDANTIFSMI